MMAPLHPGLQAERTALAWIRTSLGVAANGALVLRMGLQGSDAFLEAAGWVLLGVAIAVYLAGTTREAAVTVAVRAGRTPTVPWRLAALAATAVLLAAVVLITILR